jgi:hypothetical protein
MINWFHKLFNPHCIHCIELDEDKFQKSLFCNSCESLKSENVFLREQNKQLLDKLINPIQSIEKETNTDDLKPIYPVREPFSVIRNRLEREDRELAKQKDIQLIKNAAKSDNGSSITNDEGKIDLIKVREELANIDKEIMNG